MKEKGKNKISIEGLRVTKDGLQRFTVKFLGVGRNPPKLDMPGEVTHSFGRKTLPFVAKAIAIGWLLTNPYNRETIILNHDMTSGEYIFEDNDRLGIELDLPTDDTFYKYLKNLHKTLFRSQS